MLLLIITIPACHCNKPPIPAPPDTEKPVITSFEVTAVSKDTASFKFSVIDNVGLKSLMLEVGGVSGSGLGKSTATIHGLDPGTSYTAILTATDAAGNIAVATVTFTTLSNIKPSAWLGQLQVHYDSVYAIEQNALSSKITITINNSASVAKATNSLMANFGTNGSAVKMIRYSLNGGSWNVLTAASGNVNFGGIALQPGVNTFICYFAIKVAAGVTNGAPLTFQFVSLDDGVGGNAPVGGSFPAAVPVGTVNSVTQATMLISTWEGLMSYPDLRFVAGTSTRAMFFQINTLRATGPTGARVYSMKLKNPYTAFTGLVWDNNSWTMGNGSVSGSINYTWQNEYITLYLPNESNNMVTNGTTYNSYYVNCSFKNTSTSTFNSNDYTSGRFGFGITSKYDLVIKNADGQVIDLSDDIVKQDYIVLSN